MTRTEPSESSTSSEIIVAGHWSSSGNTTPDPSSRVAASTPPTSLLEANSVADRNSVKATDDAVEDGHEGQRRSRRAKSGVTSYNLQALAKSQLEMGLSAEKSKPRDWGSIRNVSGLTGNTLVEGEDSNMEVEDKAGVKDNMDEDMPDVIPSTEQIPSAKLGRKPSVKDKVKKAAGKLSSALGKRGREVVEKGKDKLRRKEKVEVEDDPKQRRILKQLDTGSKGLLDELELDLEATLKLPPAKKLKTGKSAQPKTVQLPAPSNPIQKMSNGRKIKKWQTAGLYVGQDVDFDPNKPGARSRKLQKKRPTTTSSSDPAGTQPQKRLKMGLPMFAFLDRERPFTIPYDVFAPSVRKGDERPKDWHQLNKNRLIGDAKEIWPKESNVVRSVCLCRSLWNGKDEGCGDDCLNRSMEYECNADNCELPAWACSNRAFAELAARFKKGGQYDIGVEVVKTSNRGFGVKACRTFLPGQIIMEYTGEIITEVECQRRMREVYRDKSNFYLMEMERGTHIDGTKGSMARFINHSCAPNCTVRLVKVNGVPRMGVFAGEDGVMTGEELTYDYNFDNFGEDMQQCFCGASTCRGHLGKKLSATEQKKREREEIERSRLAALAAQKTAARKKAREQDGATSTGKGIWRGWVDLTDPETVKRLKAEQDEKKAREATSGRAMRLAARRQSLPSQSSKASAKIEKVRKPAKTDRRKTTAFEKTPSGRLASDSSHRALLNSAGDFSGEEEIALSVPQTQQRRSVSNLTTQSVLAPDTSSNFLEDLTPSELKQEAEVKPENDFGTGNEISINVHNGSRELSGKPKADLIEPVTSARDSIILDAVESADDFELPDSEDERVSASNKIKSKPKPPMSKKPIGANVSRKRSVLKSVQDVLSRATKKGAASKDISGKNSLLPSGSVGAQLKQSKLTFKSVV